MALNLVKLLIVAAMASVAVAVALPEPADCSFKCRPCNAYPHSCTHIPCVSNLLNTFLLGTKLICFISVRFRRGKIEICPVGEDIVTH